MLLASSAEKVGPVNTSSDLPPPLSTSGAAGVHGTRKLLALLFVVVAELGCVLYVLFGPVYVEHALLRLCADASMVMLAQRGIRIPGATIAYRAGSATVFGQVIDLSRRGALDKATDRFTDDATITTRVGNTTSQPTTRTDLPRWLELVASSVHIQAAWRIQRADRSTEVLWVTTSQIGGLGLASADVMYEVDVRDGRISRVTATYTPASASWFSHSASAQSALGTSTLEGRVAVAVGVLAVGVGGLLIVIERRHRRSLAALLATLPVFIILAFTLVDSWSSPIGGMLPDRPLFVAHATLGTALNDLGLLPRDAAIQWVKAASHAPTADAVRAAGYGIAVARRADGNSSSLDEILCDTRAHGSPRVIAALDRSGLRCVLVRG